MKHTENTQPGGGVMHMHTEECVCMCLHVCLGKEQSHVCTHTHTKNNLDELQTCSFVTVTFLGILAEDSYHLKDWFP